MSANYYKPLTNATAVIRWWVYRLHDGDANEYVVLSGIHAPQLHELEEATGMIPFPDFNIAYGPASKQDAFDFYQDIAGSETVKWSDEDA